MIVLDYQDRRPIYEQVTDKFQILILNGVLPPGSQMPSVRQLATELTVNPNTIQRAYNELESEGYIYSVPGKGSFAAANAAYRRFAKRNLEIAQIHFGNLSEIEGPPWGLPHGETSKAKHHASVAKQRAKQQE